jgi:hypothetical protein
VLIDAEGQTCVMEAAVPRIVTRDLGRDFVYATNHFVTEDLMDTSALKDERSSVTIYRYGYLRWIEEARPPRTAGDLAGILRSHEPWAPCSHAGPSVMTTAWSMIAIPAERRLSAAAGPPCSTAYEDFEV